MKRLKTLFLLTLCAAAILSLCACGTSDPAETTADSRSTKATGSYLPVSGSSATMSAVTLFPPADPAKSTSSAVTTAGTTPTSSVTTSAASSPATTPTVSATTPVSSATTSATTTAATTAAPTTPASQVTSSLPAGSVLLPIAPPSTDTRGLSDTEIFSFFNDAVFVGDSISLGWRMYVTSTRKTDSLFFGGADGAQFLVSGSLGAGNSLWPVNNESVHPTYQGTQMQLWESIPKTGAKKVFVMFGLNDAALYGVDKTIQNFGTLFGKIKAAVPDVQFYVMSATYVKAGGERGSLNSALLRKLNLALIDFCAQNGYEFINLADALADPDGNLKATYCSDGFVHQTNAAYEVWTKLLKGYAASKLK